MIILGEFFMHKINAHKYVKSLHFEGGKRQRFARVSILIRRADTPAYKCVALCEKLQTCILFDIEWS